MVSLKIACALLLGATAIQALAQVPLGADPATGARPGHEIGIGESLPLSDKASNIVPADTRSTIAPTLPSPMLGPNATLYDYLKTARQALVAGRTGEAQQSLEMAETRTLDRSVLPTQLSIPSESPLIARIQEARHAMGEGNTERAIQIIDLVVRG